MKALLSLLQLLYAAVSAYLKWAEGEEKRAAVEAAALKRSAETKEARREADAASSGLDRRALDERLRKYRRRKSAP